MSGMGEPDQIDMMTEQELRVELRGVLVDLGRMATDRAQLQYALEQSEQAFIEQRSKLGAVRDVLYEKFTKGECSALVAVGLIEKAVREAK